jgi:5'-nucleotidase / UDP-sugar diphosphatase
VRKDICLALALVAPFAAGAERTQLTILHTNDIHGHVRSWTGWEGDLKGRTVGGFDRLATAVEQERKQSKNVLLLDAGDTIGDTLAAAATKGKALIDLMNQVRYDAMVVGNHEPDFGMDTLRQRMAEARFDVIAANIVESGSNRLFAKPYVIRSIGEHKIAIVGLAYPNTALTTTKRNVAGYEFLQARETAATYIPKVRAEGAGIVVVLSHLGLSADRKLAEDVPGIDVIVGGHSHNRMKHPLRVRETVIVQSGAHLSDLGRLDLEIEAGKVVAARGRLITLDNASIRSNSEIAREVEQYVDQTGANTIAAAEAPVVRAQTLAGSEPRKRDQESPADSLFADILRHHARTDIAFLPGVGYGVAIPAGPVRKDALKNLVPHDSKVVTMSLSGADVKAILEQSIENVVTEDPVKKVGGMIQVSGISFAYDADRQFGARVQDVVVADKPLDPTRSYRIATNSMLAEGGHNYRAFTRGSERRELESQYEILERVFRERKRIQPSDSGRIIRQIAEHSHAK